MDTATLITYTFIVMFGGIGIAVAVEHYYLRRKRSRHAH